MEIRGTHSSRRINNLAIARGAKSYLEIGVDEGATFLAVDIVEKVAIDPRFRFDWRQWKTKSTTFLEMTSDQYFSAIEGERTFDIIFLDGLHTFEQTFRDFCSCVALGHRNTVYLLDDTVPSDVYSTLLNTSDVYRFRREAGKESLAWHGDVYKAVFAIHDYFPMFSYCTINTKGNPQTLVWRRPRTNFAPKFGSFEAISRLSYFDFKKNPEIMKYVEEEQALRMVIDALEEKPEGIFP